MRNLLLIGSLLFAAVSASGQTLPYGNNKVDDFFSKPFREITGEKRFY